jgi:hypothetical protein
VAQRRILVSLKAERISCADRFGRRGAERGQSARGQHGQNSNLLILLPRSAGSSFIDTSRTRARQSSHSTLQYRY